MSVKTAIFFSLCLGCSMTQAKVCTSSYTTALKYQQQSSEIQALQLQSYDLATLRLKEMMSQNPDAKNLAIVTDLDETVIDNSALLARDTKACHDYEKWDTWINWEKQGQPELIAGSLDFFNFAHEHGIKIFYVSDRTQANKAATIKSLKQLNLPNINEESVLLLDSSKQERREHIEKNYKIVMLLGDSLPDFSTDFSSKQTQQERDAAVQRNKIHFGKDWIVLPNATYGSWSKNALRPWEKPL